MNPHLGPCAAYLFPQYHTYGGASRAAVLGADIGVGRKGKGEAKKKKGAARTTPGAQLPLCLYVASSKSLNLPAFRAGHNFCLKNASYKMLVFTVWSGKFRFCKSWETGFSKKSELPILSFF